MERKPLTHAEKLYLPAVGKGLSELIRNGRYESVDLSPLSVDRIFTKELVVEEAIY